MTKKESAHCNDGDDTVAQYVNLNDDREEQQPQKLDQEQIDHDKRKQGMCLLFISAFLFSFMGLFLQFTGRMGLPSTELVFIRAMFQGTFVVIGMIFYRVDEPAVAAAAAAATNASKNVSDNNESDDDVETGPGVHLVAVHDKEVDEEKKLEDAHERISLLSKNEECKKYSAISITNQTTKVSPASSPKTLPPRIIQRPFGTTPAMCRVVILRGIIGGFGFCNFYYTLSTLPLGDATTLLSLYPIVTIFLAYFVLGEEMKPEHFAAALLSVTGATLISRPTFIFGNDHAEDEQYQPQTLGYITAFVGSLCSSCVIVLIRKAGRVGAHTLQLLFSWAVFGMTWSFTAGIVAAFLSEDQKWRIPSREEMPSVLGICITGSVAHLFLNYAAKLMPATIAGLIRSSDIFWAYMLEIIVLGQHPQKETWLGALLVISSLVVVLFSSRQKTNKGMKHLESVGNLTAAK